MEGLDNNLIPNSDFDLVDPTTSLSMDWENATSGVTVDTNAADAIRGSTSLEINATTAASDRMSQSIAVTAGETYNLSAYIRTSGVTNDQSGYGAEISSFWLNHSGALVSAQYAIWGTSGGKANSDRQSMYLRKAKFNLRASRTASYSRTQRFRGRSSLRQIAKQLLAEKLIEDFYESYVRGREQNSFTHENMGFIRNVRYGNVWYHRIFLKIE